MQRPFLLACLSATSLLLTSPVLAGADGAAGGISGFSPVGGSSLTPIGTTNFSNPSGSQVVVPVAANTAALAEALVTAGLNEASADGVLALVLNQMVNGLAPQQAAASLVAQLQAAGAGADQAQALADSLAQFGVSPSLPTLIKLVDVFNALVVSADATVLQTLTPLVTPIRGYLIGVIENLTIDSTAGLPGPQGDGSSIVGGALSEVSSQVASANFTAAEAIAQQQTAESLGLPGGNAPPPTVGEIQGLLQQVQGYIPAVLSVSFTSQQQIGAAGFSLPPGAELQVPKATYVAGLDKALVTSGLARAADSNPGNQGFVDITLILPRGAVVGRRVEVATKEFATLLRRMYNQLARRESLGVDSATAPARQLYELLLAPVRAELTAAGVSTLLISADRGLQAIPYGALHDGKSYLGQSFAFALTPSLGLMPRTVPKAVGGGQQMAAGASLFIDGMSPLPLVPQELSQVEAAARGLAGKTYLNEAFTPQVLLNQAGDPRVNRVHVATHAEFLPGGPTKARIYTGTSTMSLTDFASLRQRRGGAPLDLFVLSACRTALGDKGSELGFAGLALQAGSRSAIGSLWYVDDVATAAYFIQFYRYLDAGMPKAMAMQATQLAMANGSLRVEGEQLLAADGSVLLRNLTPSQQSRMEAGLSHPFYWAGITLLGTPW